MILLVNLLAHHQSLFEKSDQIFELRTKIYLSGFDRKLIESNPPSIRFSIPCYGKYSKYIIFLPNLGLFRIIIILQ